MLKGINHQMIEVTDTDSPYFDRAFFVLKADCADEDLARLQEDARRVLLAAGGYSALRRNRLRNRRIRIFWAILGATVGTLVSLCATGWFFR